MNDTNLMDTIVPWENLTSQTSGETTTGTVTDEASSIVLGKSINAEVYEQGTFSPVAFTTDPLPYGSGTVNFPGIPRNLIYRLAGFVSIPGNASSYSIKIGELATTSPATPLQEINVVSNGSSIQEDGITGIGRAVSVMAPGAIARNASTSAPVILTTAYIRADNSVNPLVQEVFVVVAGPANFTCNITLDILVGIPEGYTFTWTR
jgi:hypothetical protein